MNYSSLYSERLQDLIKFFEFDDRMDNPNLPPHLLFREIGLHCFRNNIEGKEVDSIRRILRRLESNETIDWSARELDSCILL